MNSKGVSLIISYVLLIVIAIIMSIIVFNYLRYVANVEPVIDCKPETSLVIDDYICESGQLSLVIRNNGRFNVSGFIPSFGGNPLREPTVKLTSLDEDRTNYLGEYVFENPLPPSEAIEVHFSNFEIKADGNTVPIDFDNIVKIRIQPFIYDDESGLNVACTESIIRQNLEDCSIV